MRLSDDKINHLSHLLKKHIMTDDNFEIFVEENDIRLHIQKIITQELKIDEEIDQKVHKKLESYSRPIIEGTNEWDILYKRMYDEELNKLGRL